jgi:hypothetical protein
MQERVNNAVRCFVFCGIPVCGIGNAPQATAVHITRALRRSQAGTEIETQKPLPIGRDLAGVFEDRLAAKKQPRCAARKDLSVPTAP